MDASGDILPDSPMTRRTAAVEHYRQMIFLKWSTVRLLLGERMYPGGVDLTVKLQKIIKKHELEAFLILEDYLIDIRLVAN